MTDIVRRHHQTASNSNRDFELGRVIRDMLRWDPLQELATLSRGDVTRGMYVPAFELKETKDAYVIKADLPGVREEDTEIEVSGNRLTINGKREEERRQENETVYISETTYGVFSRSFILPEGVNVDGVRAEMKNGQLIIEVPKREELQARRISLSKSEMGKMEGAKVESGKQEKGQKKDQPHIPS